MTWKVDDFPHSGPDSRKAPPSPNEGRVLTARGIGGRRFLIINGVRQWIDTPPKWWKP
jgi:hypothetical protein